MQTTLTIDDVLAAAEELAAQDNKSVGEVLSELSRRALGPSAEPVVKRNGITLLPLRPNGHAVTNELVRKLQLEIGE